MTADRAWCRRARRPVLDARRASGWRTTARRCSTRARSCHCSGTILRVRPFANPGQPATIVPGRPAGGSPVRALSAILKQALVTVRNGMIGTCPAWRDVQLSPPRASRSQ
jgi:hypothetical protein